MHTPRDAVRPVDDLVIVMTVHVPLDAAAAFRLFSEGPELQSWLCIAANTEPKLGGRYELFWEPSDPENDSTIGCRITAYEPDRLIAFQWRSPRQFKALANAADPLTHVVVAFHRSAGGCAVTLVHSGWRSTADWARAAAWQQQAWNHAFKALESRAQRLAGGAA